MSKYLENKVVIITGASTGIGKETALAFAKEKSIVILAARRVDKLSELAQTIHSVGGQTEIVQTDVSRPEDIDNLIKVTLEKCGRIDIFINNAGFGILGLIEETSLQDIQDILQTNLVGPYYAMHKVIPIMKKQGNGHIMNVASIIGKRGMALNSAYCATKFALIGLSESAQVELRGTPIKVSSIIPGLTSTDFGLALRDYGHRVKKNIWLNGVPASKVANAIIRCAKHPKREVYITLIDRTFIFANSLFPGFVEFLLSHYRRK